MRLLLCWSAGVLLGCWAGGLVGWYSAACKRARPHIFVPTCVAACVTWSPAAQRLGFDDTGMDKAASAILWSLSASRIWTMQLNNAECAWRADLFCHKLTEAVVAAALCARRIAIEQQAALVPVLALGEVLQLRNLYDMPALQQYTYKRLGFPGRRWCVPHSVMGLDHVACHAAAKRAACMPSVQSTTRRDVD